MSYQKPSYDAAYTARCARVWRWCKIILATAAVAAVAIYALR